MVTITMRSPARFVALVVGVLSLASTARAAAPKPTTTNTDNVTLSETFCDTAFGTKTVNNAPTLNVTWTWSTTSTLYGHKQIVTISPATDQTIKTVHKTQTSTFTAQNTITSTVTLTTTSTIITTTSVAERRATLTSTKTVTSTFTHSVAAPKGYVPILSQSKASSWGADKSAAKTIAEPTPSQPASTAEPSPTAKQRRDANIAARFEGSPGTIVQNVTCCTQFFVWDTVASPDATTTITSHTGRVRTITSVDVTTTTVTQKKGPTTTTLTVTSTGLTTSTTTVTPPSSPPPPPASSSSPAAASSSSTTTSPAAASSTTTSSGTGSGGGGGGSGARGRQAVSPMQHAASIPISTVTKTITATTTAYAQCASNNALSTLGLGAGAGAGAAAGTAGQHAIASAGALYSAHAPGIGAAHGCCVACARQVGCAGYMFVTEALSASSSSLHNKTAAEDTEEAAAEPNGRNDINASTNSTRTAAASGGAAAGCTLFISKTCAPAKAAWSFRSVPPPSTQETPSQSTARRTLVIGNGACGVAAYLGDM